MSMFYTAAAFLYGFVSKNCEGDRNVKVQRASEGIILSELQYVRETWGEDVEESSLEGPQPCLDALLGTCSGDLL